jgi:hypothetical protein
MALLAIITTNRQVSNSNYYRLEYLSLRLYSSCPNRPQRYGVELLEKEGN